MKETVCILSLPAESRGLGGNPMTRKIQKITPEWQSEPFFCSVGSAVSRVKGKHHDGDAAKLGGILCRQFRWYRELFRPVGMKGFFYLLKSEACKAGINFHKLAYPKIYYDLFAKQIYRKSEGFEVHSSFEVYSSFLRGLSDFHIDSKTAAKTAPS